MTALLAVLLLNAAPGAVNLDAWALPAARPCTVDEIHELTSETDAPYRLTCRAVLTPGQAIRRPVLIEGGAASGYHWAQQMPTPMRPKRVLQTLKPVSPGRK